MPLVWSFLVFITVLMAGLSVIGMNIWGVYMIEYKNFPDAFLSIIFIHMGLLNYDWMQYYSPLWSISFILLYTLVIIFILMSSFILFFIDSYRRVVL